MVNAIDRGARFSAAEVDKLKNAGIKYAGRYIGRASSWKTLQPDEVSALTRAGIKIISIYETNPVKVSYFTAEQGKSDAVVAEAAAKAIGQPAGTPIYFAVDYDAGLNDFAPLRKYFGAVRAALRAYKVGVYGSYGVLQNLAASGYVQAYYQTYAWSRGRVYEDNDVYQYKNGQNLDGMTVDYNEVNRPAVAWNGSTSEAAKPEKTPEKPAASTGTPNPYVVKSGDTLSEIGARIGVDWHDLKKWNGLKDDLIFPGQKLKTKAPAKKPATSSSASVVPYPGHLIKNGSKGKDVVRIQNAVGVKADGDFGPATEKAVRAYQQRHGLTADGIVGPKTWGVLF